MPLTFTFLCLNVSQSEPSSIDLMPSHFSPVPIPSASSWSVTRLQRCLNTLHESFIIPTVFSSVVPLHYWSEVSHTQLPWVFFDINRCHGHIVVLCASYPISATTATNVPNLAACFTGLALGSSETYSLRSSVGSLTSSLLKLQSVVISGRFVSYKYCSI